MAHRHPPPALEGPECNHVYISYDDESESDTVLARDLANDLSQHLPGLEVKLRETTEITDPEVIECSQKVILIVTESYLTNPRLQQEARTAMLIVEELQQPRRLLVLRCGKDLPTEGALSDLSKYATLEYNVTDKQKIFLRLREFAVSKTKYEQSVIAAGQPAIPLALSYFYGFLNLVLPERDIKDEENPERVCKESIHDRIQGYSKWMEEPTERNMPKKMLIIIPESCFCPPELEGPGLEHTKSYIHCSASRAGNPHRDYKSSVYKVTDEADGKDYFFIAEYAAPVLCMFEMWKDGIIGFLEQDMRHHARLFYHALKAILDHGPESRRQVFGDKCSIIFLKDADIEKKSLRDIFLPVIKAEIQKDLEQELEEHTTTVKDVYTLPQDLTGQRALQDIRSQTSTPSTGPHVAAQLDLTLVPTYPMTKNPRGKALILNVVHFDPALNLVDRRGAQQDTDALLEILRRMKFQTEVVTDPTADGIRSALLRYSSMDHSNYDCFICVVLTHGKMGVVLGCDGNEVKITDMTERFSSRLCPTLRGKPKIFFIQACQGTSSSPEPSSDVTPTDSAEVPPSPSAEVATAEDINDDSIFEDGQLELSSIESDALPDHPRVLAPRDPVLPPQVQPQRSEEGQVQGTAAPSLPLTSSRPDTLVPGHEDFIMGYATLPGSASYRYQESGSLYIQALCEELKEHGSVMYLDSVLRRVTERVKQRLREIVLNIQRDKPSYRLRREQVPFFLETAPRHVRLNPSH